MDFDKDPFNAYAFKVLLTEETRFLIGSFGFESKLEAIIIQMSKAIWRR